MRDAWIRGLADVLAEPHFYRGWLVSHKRAALDHPERTLDKVVMVSAAVLVCTESDYPELLDGGRNLCDVGKTERQNRLMRLPMSYMLPAAGSCILQAPCVPGKCGGGKRERGKGREGVASGRPCRARRQGLLPCRRAADPPQQAVSGIEAPNDSLMHDTTIPHGSLLF